MEDLLIKGEYLRQQLQKGLNSIFESQRSVAARKIDRSMEARKSRSGVLMDSLQNPEYKLTAMAAGVQGLITYPREIRFQDMKHLGNWRIYNKQIWRILYKETFANMRFEFSEWLRTQTTKGLQEAFTTINRY